jgi:small-conductance mechanosensitive channel
LIALAARATAAAASKVPQDISGAEAFKDAVTQQSGTVGGFVSWLDAFGFTVGATRVSAWSVLVVVVVIVGLFLFARIGNKVAHRLFARLTALDAGRRLLAEKLLSIVIWTFAILVGIDLLGIDLTALAVFSGAFGLAIGFGLQKTFGNLLAGIILLMDRSIKPGDVIAINDGVSNTVGQVKKIGLRAVSVTTRDKKEYLIPNENLMINQVENWSYSSRDVRVRVPVTVSGTCDL